VRTGLAAAESGKRRQGRTAMTSGLGGGIGKQGQKIGWAGWDGSDYRSVE
jgi:hypothetical protein